MRFAIVTVVLAMAGCPSLERETLEDDHTGGGSGAGAPGECSRATDCVPAGAKCCDCPTHAVPISDASHRACSTVMCPEPQCGSPMQADCEAGKCVLECKPVPCDLSCADGFETDGNGCLVCACQPSGPSECDDDADCARVRADCCGCAMGGKDTSVPVTQITAHETQLMCPASPSCPGVYDCAPDLAARCVQGSCTLVAGTLPANACGRADLAPCPAEVDCVLNASDPATMEGVGVCQPFP